MEFNRVENVKRYINIYDRGASNLLGTYLDNELAKEESGLIPFDGKFPITLDGEIIIDLARVNNGFFLGGAGRGKTATVYSILTQLILLNDPKDLEIVIVDLRVYDWLTTMSAFAKANNVSRIEFEEFNWEESYTILYKELNMLLNFRREQLAKGSNLVDKVLIFDDLLLLLRILKIHDVNKYINMMGLIYILVSEAESLKLHNILLAQHPQEISQEIIKHCDLTLLFSLPRISDATALGYHSGLSVEYPYVLYNHKDLEEVQLGEPLYVVAHPNTLLSTTLALCEKKE